VTSPPGPATAPIVIADADPGARSQLVGALRQHGYEVLEAENGLEALLYVKRTRPGAVIVNLDLPRVNGLEFLRRVRIFDAGIRVVIVGATIDAQRSEARAEGAVAALGRPVPIADVLAAITGPPPAPLPPRAAASAQRPPARGRILIVDDNTELCSILEEALAPLGHAVQTAPDAASALRLITQGAPDVVLLDIDLPGLSGIAALPAIHAIAPTARVIMVSGTNDDALARRALAHGAFDYVVKPVDLDRITEIVTLALVF
jgi:DNA-binding NtrC family response regulator